jgi:hypothetical protein
MLGRWVDFPIYTGGAFTYTGRTIGFFDGDYFWQYYFSGLSLNIIDEYNEVYSYVRGWTTISPLEGIWKITGGDGYDKNYDMYMVFTGDIMAMGDDYEYEGFKVDFNGNQFYPNIEFFEIEEGSTISQAELEAYIEEEGLLWEYSVRGRSLTINLNDENSILTKVY